MESLKGDSKKYEIFLGIFSELLLESFVYASYFGVGREMKEERLTFWVCEDSEDQWDCQKEALEEFYPGCSVKHFENAGYTIGVTGSPDFIVIDVGGIMGLGCDIVALTRANVEGMSEEHPGAIFILFSAIGHYAEECYEAIKPGIQACSEWMDGCDFHQLIKKQVDKWL